MTGQDLSGLIHPDELDIYEEDEQVNDALLHLRDIAELDNTKDEALENESEDEDERTAEQLTQSRGAAHKDLDRNSALDEATLLNWQSQHQERLMAAAKILWGSINELVRISAAADHHVLSAQKKLISAEAQVGFIPMLLLFLPPLLP